MNGTKTLVALFPVLLLAACGGGGDGDQYVPPTGPETGPPTENMETGTPDDGGQAAGRPAEPDVTMQFGITNRDHYPLNAVNPCAETGGHCWRMTEEESGIASREDVIAFLHESYWDRSSFPLYVNRLPRTVRVVNHEAAEGSVAEVSRAIDRINAWLPWARHLTMGEPIPGNVWLPRRAAFKALEDAGEIGSPEFGRLAELTFPGNDFIVIIDPEHGGCGTAGARTVTLHPGCVNPGAIQHELLHLLSAEGSRTWNEICVSDGGTACHDHFQADRHLVHVPVSRFPESTMAYGSPRSPEHDSHGLSQIDGEVLQAIHTRESHWMEIDFPPNVISDSKDFLSFSGHDLGPWDDVVVRHAGSIGSWPYAEDALQPAFGVDWRNGLARPWTVGRTAGGTFAGSGLSGSATWTGALAGFTPGREAVQGDSAINVDLALMTGNAAFTALERWDAHAAPGERGSGVQWHDGDLNYTLALDGPWLRSDGGDEGYVSGRFVGGAHEGAVGILERPDLTAAFGATR